MYSHMLNEKGFFVESFYKGVQIKALKNFFSGTILIGHLIILLLKEDSFL